MTDTERAAILDMHGQGTPKREIAELLSWSTSSVARVLREAGVSRPHGYNGTKKASADLDAPWGSLPGERTRPEAINPYRTMSSLEG